MLCCHLANKIKYIFCPFCPLGDAWALSHFKKYLILCSSINNECWQIKISLILLEWMEIGMRINSTNCAILRFGPQYANACTTVWFQDSPIDFCNKAKYLGIQLQSNKVFSVDLSYCKAKFYRAFNGLFHRAAKLRNEITTLHLVSSYCKPHLL